MSMNVNTTGTVYGSYQNTYKAGTVDKKKETAKTTENDKESEKFINHKNQLGVF